MIDKTKTIGATKNFDSAKINELISTGLINNVANLERAIFSLEYLGQLQKEGLDFIFKGGSAIQVILQDKWARLSVDADICSNVSEKELIEIMSNIYQKFGKTAFSFKFRDRTIAGSIPFYLFILEAPSIAVIGETRSCLLDVMGIKPNYATTQVALKTPFFDSDLTITTPTIGALLGDKLSTIGPNTMGRHLVDSRNGLEYAKHFYDIKTLQEADFNFKDCCLAFHEAIDLQSKIRSKNLSVQECCEDLFFTCKVASLPQNISEQLIAKLSEQPRMRARSEFRILRDGLARFRPFLVRGLTYSWDDLRYCAALTALLTKMAQIDLSEKKIKAILKANMPSKKEEIQSVAAKVAAVPEQERWFIQLSELVNFPRILQTWHGYFFLEPAT
ncbi:MAG: nucleotidyl transferase AbiEii/AbiGii toxin family protein [Thermoproteota archaeon]|nr:nucleotidyl transferase AbiEii/AbiGii toxin family protein [Thermoproteota archaeon]NLD66863.1 nucleotidyl transferase AbiEii/AbiGii toxin family protein [Thermoproteota archaeon]